MLTGEKGLIHFLDKYYDFIEDDGVRNTAQPIPFELTTEELNKKKEEPLHGWERYYLEDKKKLGYRNIETKKTRVTRPPDTNVEETFLVGPDVICKGITIQQDNAGGHGFANGKNGSKATAPQIQASKELANAGYSLINQPPNSPGFNMLDLGFWYSLKCRLRERAPAEIDWNQSRSKIEAKIWEILKEEVQNFDPIKLRNIALQKQAMMKSALDVGGKYVTREPHWGIRRLFGNKLFMF